ncbi:AP2 domain-containing protein [Candidatus Oscillochloris fontis]|uniref:AP2 domain-containing protein n=1 Tax=Candidatus Oscillochloris fontis TaxID=2496868 RepID=UPI00101D0DE2|nr:AP2 domain-containing protein [Candidatus Oscillochloris fontis]
MRLERRRDGKVYVLEAYSPDADELRRLLPRWPGGYVQWEATGILLPTEEGMRPRSSGPIWALWRPRDVPEQLPELEDPAEFLDDPLTPPSPAEPSALPIDDLDDELTPPLNHVEADTPRRARRYVPPRLQPRTTKYKNLTRIESSPKHRPGYLVRVTWAKKTYTKYFADAAYGDRLGSLAAAVEWRDQVERDVGKPRTNRPAIGVAYSNTGIVGISRTTKAGKPIFQVTWYEEGKQRRRVFSIDLLGEQKALKAARKVRAEIERQK